VLCGDTAVAKHLRITIFEKRSRFFIYSLKSIECAILSAYFACLTARHTSSSACRQATKDLFPDQNQILGRQKAAAQDDILDNLYGCT